MVIKRSGITLVERNPILLELYYINILHAYSAILQVA